jgi:hypothetical protein
MGGNCTTADLETMLVLMEGRAEVEMTTIWAGSLEAIRPMSFTVSIEISTA